MKPSRKEIEMETKTADWTRNNYIRQEGRRERHAQVRPNPNTGTETEIMNRCQKREIHSDAMQAIYIGMTRAWKY